MLHMFKLELFHFQNMLSFSQKTTKSIFQVSLKQKREVNVWAIRFFHLKSLIFCNLDEAVDICTLKCQPASYNFTYLSSFYRLQVCITNWQQYFSGPLSIPFFSLPYPNSYISKKIKRQIIVPGKRTTQILLGQAGLVHVSYSCRTARAVGNLGYGKRRLQITKMMPR